MTTWLITGLGNPGREYQDNRHNIGFMGLEALAEKYGTGVEKKAFQSLVQAGTIDGVSVILQKPQTYMNLSGEAVGACARFYKIPVENLIVLHDELDIPAASLRVKQGGGHAGHNGLRSIDQHFGNNYWRVRMGIGHPGDRNMVSNYVLSDFAKDEWPWVDDMCDLLRDNFSLLLKGQQAKLAALFKPVTTTPEDK